MAAQRIFDNSALRIHPQQELVKANIAEQFGMSTTQLTEQALTEAIQKGDIALYDEDAICRFYADVQKSVDAEEDIEKKEQLLEKAHKDLGKLIRTTVIDKNGHKRTVYIARKEYKSHTEHHAEIHATISRQRALLANPKSPQSAKNRAHEIIKTEQAKLDKLTEGTKKEGGDFKANWNSQDMAKHGDTIFHHQKERKKLYMLDTQSSDPSHEYHKPVNSKEEADGIIGRTLDGGAEDHEWKKKEHKPYKFSKEEQDANHNETLADLQRQHSSAEKRGDASKVKELKDSIDAMGGKKESQTERNNRIKNELAHKVLNTRGKERDEASRDLQMHMHNVIRDAQSGAKKEEADDKHEVKVENYTWGNKLSIQKNNKEVGVMGHTDGKGPDHISQMQGLKAGESMTFNDSNDQKVKITAKDGKGNYTFQRLNLRGEPTTEPGGSFFHAGSSEGPKGKKSGGARLKTKEGDKKVDAAFDKLAGEKSLADRVKDGKWSKLHEDDPRTGEALSDEMIMNLGKNVWAHKEGDKGKVTYHLGDDSDDGTWPLSEKLAMKVLSGEVKYKDAVKQAEKDMYGGDKKEPKKLPKSNVSVEGEAHYEFANGKPPRGQGSWIFGLGIKDIDWNKHKKDEDYIQTPVMSYSDAKKLALEAAAKKGKPFIHIMS